MTWATRADLTTFLGAALVMIEYLGTNTTTERDKVVLYTSLVMKTGQAAIMRIVKEMCLDMNMWFK